MSDAASLSSVMSHPDAESLPTTDYTPPSCSTMTTANDHGSISTDFDSLSSDSGDASAQSRDPMRPKPYPLLPEASRPALPQRCPSCPEEFMTRRFLNLHVRHMHDRAPVHHCPHCRGPYATAADLNEHILRDHRAEPRPYKCDKCPCSYSSQLSLRLHAAETHARVERACDECGFTTRFERAFRRHMKQVHDVTIEPDIGAHTDGGYQAKEARTIGFIPT